MLPPAEVGTGPDTPRGIGTEERSAPDPTTVRVAPKVIRSRIDALPERRLPESVATPEPEVRVSIGRVEVKAVTPPEPVRRKTSTRPEPALSLDEYLARRNGGQG